MSIYKNKNKFSLGVMTSPHHGFFVKFIVPGQSMSSEMGS